MAYCTKFTGMSGGVDWAKAKPGDVLFFPPEEGDPVGGWIAEADTGRFSHVGMNIGDGYVVNAVMRSPGLAVRQGFDFGGVVVMPMDEMVGGRSGTPYLGRPAVDPAAALAAASCFVEGTTRPLLHKSGFSMSKSLLMMAALCAAHSGDDRLKHLVLRAGGLWSVDEEMARRETPSFICAEFVAQCYGMPFRWSDLENTLKVGHVPDAAMHEGEPPEGAEAVVSPAAPSALGVSPTQSELLGELGEGAVGVLEEARDVFDHSLQQELALWRVFERLRRRHEKYWHRCLKSGGQLIMPSDARVTHAPDDDAEGETFPGPSGPATKDPDLPFCLVTPRTLSGASWFDWVRPIRFT